jgi:hypothetical protein
LHVGDVVHRGWPITPRGEQRERGIRPE